MHDHCVNEQNSRRDDHAEQDGKNAIKHRSMNVMYQYEVNGDSSQRNQYKTENDLLCSGWCAVHFYLSPHTTVICKKSRRI